MRYHVTIGHHFVGNFKSGERTVLRISAEPPQLIPEGKYVLIPIAEYQTLTKQRAREVSGDDDYGRE